MFMVSILDYVLLLLLSLNCHIQGTNSNTVYVQQMCHIDCYSHCSLCHPKCFQPFMKRVSWTVTRKRQVAATVLICRSVHVIVVVAHICIVFRVPLSK